MSEGPEQIVAETADSEGGMSALSDKAWLEPNDDPDCYGLWSHSHETGFTEYIRADLVPQWQPIETAPDRVHVLATWGGGTAVAEQIDGEWYDPFASRNIPHSEPPTHWQPLPEPPA